MGAATDTRVARELAQHTVTRLPETWQGSGKEARESKEETEEKFQDWRVGKDRSKTSHALLLLCLNVGVDPPDVLRVEPCAKLECWTDPMVAQSKMLTKGSVVIGDLLEKQYKQLQKSATYKICLELSVDDLMYHLSTVRKKAKEGRVLLHYNGHGVPKVTQFGELWFFDTEHRQYVPVTITEIMQCVGSPTIYILDCSNAGAVLQYWYTHHFHQSRPRDMLICACRRQEELPLNPALPADLLTSCLTTPVKMSLEWYYEYSLRECLLPKVTREMLNAIPGSAQDRKTPLGELHWIFTAVTDAIAWCTLDRELFNRLFRPRNDMLQVSLFRNFLLAERIMRDAGCVPVTHPPLPPSHAHPLWEIWELSLETVLSQLPKMLNADLSVNTSYAYKPSSFFADQLTAFEVSVDFAGKTQTTPDQLPCIIQGLSSHQHRLRSLKLLTKYLDLGSWAVQDALSCGVMPYVVRLLHQPDLINCMVLIWTKLLLVDSSEATMADLIKVQMPPAKKFLKVINMRLDQATLPASPPAEAGLQQPHHAPAGNPAGSANSSLAPGDHHEGEGAGAAPSAAAPPLGGAAAQQSLPASVFPLLEGTTVDQVQAMAFFVISMIMATCGRDAQVPCWNWGLLTGCLSCVLPLSEVSKLLAPAAGGAGARGGGAAEGVPLGGAGDAAPPASGLPSTPDTSSVATGGGGSSAAGGAAAAGDLGEHAEASALCKSWALMCLAQLVADIPRAIEYCVVTRELHSAVLVKILSDPSQTVRACAVHALAKFVGLGADSIPASGSTAAASAAPPSAEGGDAANEKSLLLCDVELLRILATVVNDPSPLVREEVFYALLVFFVRYNVSPDSDTLTQPSSRTGSSVLQVPDTVSLLSVSTPTTNYTSIQQVQNTHPSLFPMLHSSAMAASLPGVHNQGSPGGAGTPAPPAASSVTDLRLCLLMDVRNVMQPLLSDPFPKLADLAAMEHARLCQIVNAMHADSGAAGAASPAHAKGLPKSQLFRWMSRQWRKPVFHADVEVAVAERKRHRDLTNKDVLQNHMMKVGERQFVATLSGPPEKISKDSVSVQPLAQTAERIVCSEFRSFANEAILTDAANNIGVYETLLHRMVNHAVHPAPVAQTFLVNDATDSPRLLVTDKRGVVSVYSKVIPPKASSSSTKGTGMQLETSFLAGTSAQAKVCADWDSMDGTLLFSGDGSKIQMYSLSEERLVQNIALPPRCASLRQLKTDSTGLRTIAGGFDDGTVRLWDARAGGGHRLFAQLSASSQADPTTEVVLRLSSYQLFSAHKSGVIRVWDLRGRMTDSRKLDAYKHPTCSFAAAHHTYPVIVCGHGSASQAGNVSFLSTKNVLLGDVTLPKVHCSSVSLHKYQPMALVDKYLVTF